MKSCETSASSTTPPRSTRRSSYERACQRLSELILIPLGGLVMLILAGTLMMLVIKLVDFAWGD